MTFIKIFCMIAMKHVEPCTTASEIRKVGLNVIRCISPLLQRASRCWGVDCVCTFKNQCFEKCMGKINPQALNHYIFNPMGAIFDLDSFYCNRTKKHLNQSIKVLLIHTTMKQGNQSMNKFNPPDCNYFNSLNLIGHSPAFFSICAGTLLLDK